MSNDAGVCVVTTTSEGAASRPGATPSPSADSRDLLAAKRWLRDREGETRRWAHVSALLALLAAVGSVGFAGTLAWAIDRVAFAPESWDAASIALALVVGGTALLLRLTALAVRDHHALQIAADVKSAVRCGLRARIESRGPVRLRGDAPPGDWVERYQDQVEALTGHFARYRPALQAVIVMSPVYLAVVFWLDWLAAMLLLLAFPLIPLFMALIGMGSVKVHERQQDAEAELAGHFLDRLRALDWIRRAGAGAAMHSEVAERSQDLRKLTMRVLRVAFLSSAVMEFFSAVAIAMVAVYIGFSLFGAIGFGPASELTLFSGLFILLLAPELFAPLRLFAQRYHDRAEALAAAAGLQPIWSPALQHDRRAARGDRAAGGSPAWAGLAGPGIWIALESVDVGYPDDTSGGPDDPDAEDPTTSAAAQPVLSGVSMQIGDGEIVALVGPSGVGKSTLLALLAGFLAPTHGLPHDVPGDADHARAFDRASKTDSQGRVWRAPPAGIDAEAFVWVGQGAHLFFGTLRENLLLGHPTGEATDAELETALALAGLAVGSPELPGGLGTRIGESHHGVSGGQAERIAIARGYVAGATRWLLDEPTAALDAETEKLVLDALVAHARARGWSLVVATHRNAVIERADRVVDVSQWSGQWSRGLPNALPADGADAPSPSGAAR